MTFPKIGNLAPNFSLQNQNNETITLKDYRGEKNVVVYFYPRANTPGCTTQACGIRDHKKAFADLDTVVLALSPDTVKKLQNFTEKQSLNFDLLADPDHAVADKYGVWGLKKFMGRESMGILRTTFIVDKKGKLRHIMDKVKTKTHDQDVLEILKTL